MPKLEFVQPHKSMQPFEPIDIEPFTLITGLNGSGKTHLLEAIANSAARLQGVPQNQVRYYDFKTFRPEAREPYQSSKYEDARNGTVKLLRNAIKSADSHLRAAAQEHGVIGVAPTALRGKTLEELLPLVGNDQGRAGRLKVALQRATSDGDEEWQEALARIPHLKFQLESDPILGAIHPGELTESQLEYLARSSWGTGTLIGHNFSYLFGAYRDNNVRESGGRLRSVDVGA